jgi:hypothetical protein
VSFVLAYDFTPRLNISANWVYQSGKPVTLPEGNMNGEGLLSQCILIETGQGFPIIIGLICLQPGKPENVPTEIGKVAGTYPFIMPITVKMCFRIPSGKMKITSTRPMPINYTCLGSFHL